MIPREEVSALKQQKKKPAAPKGSGKRPAQNASSQARQRRPQNGAASHTQAPRSAASRKAQVQDHRSQAAVPAQDSILHAGQLPIMYVLLSSALAHRSKAANVRRSRVLGVRRRRAGESRSADCAGAESWLFCWCLSPVWPWPLR